MQKILQGKTAGEAAKDLISNTKLDDVAVRKELYEGGQSAIEASTDPLIVAMRAIDVDARASRREYRRQSRVRGSTGWCHDREGPFRSERFYPASRRNFHTAVELWAGERVSGEREGNSLRDQYRQAHTSTPPSMNNKPPYNLPESWMKAKPKLDLKTPLNFVSTADIIGGNSGSPTVNKKGEVVGIIFDGNIESLPWNFAYSDTQARAVSVDSRGIQEALRKIYGATALADELTGTKAAAVSPGK